MILKLFKDKPEKQEPEEPLQKSAVLRVIGDRASGKTTYMAALARWPNASPNSPVQNVMPITTDGEELIAKAQMILEQGLQMEPTALITDVNDIKDYALSIVLREQFSLKSLKTGITPNLLTLNVNCKDYAGEFFSDVLHRAGDPQLEDYLEDCAQAEGLMLLLDGNARRRDAEYANGIDRLLVSLDRSDISITKRRIALVLTKCEMPDLWVSRFKPKELAEAKFPQVCRKLKAWEAIGSGAVEFFTNSAFGMLGTQFPEPNSKKIDRNEFGMRSVLKDSKRWRPFGLVAPIYWLCTGQRHKDLEKD
jgi:hypothetical protein